MGAITFSGLHRHGWVRRMGMNITLRGINLLGRTDPVGELGVWQFMLDKILMCRR